MNKSQMVKELIAHYSNGNNAQFASMLGVKPQTISSWISRDTFDLELIYSKCVDVSANWLLTGKGPMLESDAVTPTRHMQDLTQFGIPLIPAKAMAGFFTGEVIINEADCEQINVPGVKADFAIPVSGDSMTPLYLSGDMVICQFVNLSDMFFQWGKVYVINTNQGVLLKKVRPGSDKHSIKLISENSDYDPIDLPLSDIYQIALVKGLVRLV